ncbi:ferritin-like domain-containing protein [Phytoactinopolyspora halotolerans]|uniref:Ferritin-like domain-containing protein n=2 Tax=Phytoactinopolyspora halotolerans TaxID=1981512 RepID=A0A6L9S4G1_9ACTN|nr:ferritin-like domain-containing protein [Phytoactinopolyspora halotolerans]
MTPPDTPAPDGEPDPADTVLAAVQAALAGEHACVYGYGVVGAFLDGDEQAAAQRALETHEAQRDALYDQVVALEASPEAALPSYALPFQVDDASSARELAAVLEERLAAVYVDLVATASAEELRSLAADSVIAAARARLRWTDDIPAFPGLDGR